MSVNFDALGAVAQVAGPYAAIFMLLVWLFRLLATDRLVTGATHRARVEDAEKRAEIYRDMANTTMDGLREQLVHTNTALTEIKALVIAGRIGPAI